MSESTSGSKVLYDFECRLLLHILSNRPKLRGSIIVEVIMF
jgi:hypothetical protein